MTLEGRRVVVVGLGVSGLAAAEALSDEGAAVLVSEARPLTDPPASLLERGVEIRGGGNDLSHLDGADSVVVSPGVPEDAPIVQEALRRGLFVGSELDLGVGLTEAKFIGVTGTNGKTTTTAMVAACLTEAGVDAVACGNIGFPFVRAAREDHDVLVVEASSFQLRFTQKFDPQVSVLLNIAEDHLDWHGSFERYRDAKARIFRNQRTPGMMHVGNLDDPIAREVSRGAIDVAWFTLRDPEASRELIPKPRYQDSPGDSIQKPWSDDVAGFEDGELVVLAGDDRHVIGRLRSDRSGFRADAAAAAMASISFGVEADAVGRALTEFEPLPHRGEVIATAGEVRFVDDSKATNPHAALAALEGMTDVVLIAGGLTKGVDLSPLVGAAGQLSGVVAIGEAADEIEDLFSGIVPVRRAQSIEQAVAAAFDLASPGATVMLAPGCASQDMFKDYEERGELFTRAARELAAERVQRES